MQRFVTLRSSTCDLSLSSSFLSPAGIGWKRTYYGPDVSVIQLGRTNPCHLFRGSELSVSCCQGGQNRNHPPKLGNRDGSGIRNNQSASHGALGNRHVGPDPDYYERHHPRNNLQVKRVADAIRDFPSDSWWAPEDDDSYTVPPAAAEDRGSSVGVELWASRILIQLSVCFTLLGYSPAKFDEWLVELEVNRRLNLNKKFIVPVRSEISSSSPLSDTLRDCFTGESLRRLRKKLLSVYFAGESRISKRGKNVVSASSVEIESPAERFWPLERLDMAFEALRNSGLVQWLPRMTKTYGSSFMLLVALGYATQGFRCFPWFAVGYMLKDGLQVDPSTMQFLLSSAAIPMVAKPIYGIISDTVYIRGAHRVPYLVIAGFLQVISWGAVSLWPRATSSAVILTVALTLGNMGAAIGDVINDALVAEVGKKQKGSGKGELQSFAWLIMASGGVLGNLLGGFALKRFQITTIFFIFLCLIVMYLLTCLLVSERSFDLAQPRYGAASATPADDSETRRRKNFPEENATALRELQQRRKQQQSSKVFATGDDSEVSLKMESSSSPTTTTSISPPHLYAQLRDQVGLLAQLLRRKEISHAILWFCVSYAVVPILGSSIFFYQTQFLGIDPTFIGFSRVVGQMGLMVGSQLYNRSLKGLPLRKLLGCVQALLSVCMLSDLLLVNRVNVRFGIPDSFFVLGASALVDCISQFKVLPVMVRLGQLCPHGSEGSLMAFFMSCHCLAGLSSGYLGVWLASTLHISSQSFEGLPLGIFIQAMCALVPILFINLVPGEDSVPEKVAEKVQ